jgi:hypothetical protein
MPSTGPSGWGGLMVLLATCCLKPHLQMLVALNHRPCFLVPTSPLHALQVTKYVEREILNHRLLRHPHIINLKEVRPALLKPCCPGATRCAFLGSGSPAPRAPGRLAPASALAPFVPQEEPFHERPQPNHCAHRRRATAGPTQGQLRPAACCPLAHLALPAKQTAHLGRAYFLYSADCPHGIGRSQSSWLLTKAWSALGRCS